MVDNNNENISEFGFTGNGGEYFKIWIVNILLTLLTLGIYSAWATVRKRRYFYGNTVFDGASFEYMATPLMILKGRIIAIIALLVYFVVSRIFPPLAIVLLLLLALGTPWIIWKSMRFNARMSAYRNVRFGFSGKPAALYFILIGIPLIPVLIAILCGVAANLMPAMQMIFGGIAAVAIVSIYLVIPLIQARFAHYYVNHMAFGQGRFAADITSGTYYKTYLIAFLLFISVVFLIGLFAAGAAGLLANIQAGQLPGPAAIGSIVALIVFFNLFVLWLSAYVGVRIRNYIYTGTNVDRHLQLHSSMTVN